MMLAAFLALLTAAPPPPVRARTTATGSYISDNDYPRGALRRREEGIVGFALDVSRDGRVTRCDVISSSGSNDLDLRTCQIIFVRGRFTPARDAQGAAVVDRIEGRVRWQLPER